MPRTKFNKVKPKLSYNITDEPIIISKATIDLFLKSGEYRNCMALYAFYYYTAKWQKTNQPKATTIYTATALGCSPDAIRKTKALLIKFGLIENIVAKNENNRITGHYILVKFIWKTSKTKESFHPPDLPQCGMSQSVENNRGNALSTNNINSLSYYNKMLKKNFIKKIFPIKLILDDWDKLILEWLDYKHDRNENYKSSMSLTSFRTHLQNLSNKKIDDARLIVKQSYANNYAGIFLLEKDKKNFPTKKGVTGHYEKKVKYGDDGEC